MQAHTSRAILVAFALLASTIVTPGAADAQDPSVLPDPITDRDFAFDGAPPPALVSLGQVLFFDKLLSGNRNISCATCHHPEHASSDGLSLGLGEGALGLGPKRRPGNAIETSVHERVPRNSPALFNLGAREFTRLFHDGRVEADPHGYYAGGFITPARWKLPEGLDSVLAAQAMFPVTSPTEMAGQFGENEVAAAKARNLAAGANGVWEKIAARLRAVPEYVTLFEAAFPGKVSTPEDITFVLAANAIAAFETVAFRADDAPFDRALRGEESLSVAAARGQELFYGRAGCANCHSGKFQTDHEFHAIAMPQVGPGKADGQDGSYWRETGFAAFLEDYGRGRVTAREEDQFRFRTPTLRNVARTGPWGHAGTHTTLESVIRHHVDPVTSLESYEAPRELLPRLEVLIELSAVVDQVHARPLEPARRDRFLARDDWVQSSDELRGAIAAANELAPVDLSTAEIESLVAFLESLTDASVDDLDRWVPKRVPSGLPVED